MLKKVIATVVLLSLITFVIVQAIERQQDNNNEETKVIKTAKEVGGLTVGGKAPDFRLNSVEGESVSLSDFKGKKVLMNFWATWCPPCKKEMPAIEKFYKTADKNMVVLAINVDPENDPIAYANKNHLTFPILLDHQEEDHPVSNQYQVMAIPTTYFIDSKGNIQNKFTGEMKLKDIEKNMKLLK